MFYDLTILSGYHAKTKYINRYLCHKKGGDDYKTALSSDQFDKFKNIFG